MNDKKNTAKFQNHNAKKTLLRDDDKFVVFTKL